MKRTYIYSFIVLLAFFVFDLFHLPKNSYATWPGCNPNGCSYNCDCSPCKAVDGNMCIPWNCCPVCQKPKCSDVGMDDGGCPGGCGDCDERSVSCSCGNYGSVRCHKCKGPPGPSNTPAPTLTPTNTPTPSPTPVQPTSVMHDPLPSPQAFSNKATVPALGNTTTQAQSWICLDTKPCSVAGTGCSGKGDVQHRVRITTKADAALYANKKTYIFECLQTDQGYKCTTGNRTLDQELTGADPLPSLSNAYGYQFMAFTDATGNNSIDQTDANQVIKSNAEGKIGVYEWESKTTKQVGRMMMSMQSLLDGDNLAGNQGTQKLGTFSFAAQNNETICVKIKWDPHGTVFDEDTLKPLSGVTVTLMKQIASGRLAMVNPGDIFGGIVNPGITGESGYYAFFVPNGTYFLKVEKQGYRPVYQNVTREATERYGNIYDGGAIVTSGRLETRNIAMKKVTLIDQTLQLIQGIYSSVENQLK